jgi:type IV pilus assembly protein PilZ
MKKGTSQGEHRKISRISTRTSTVIRVNYHTTDSFFTDFADNISDGGMFIATPKPLKPGTRLSLEFLLPECDYPIHVKAKVAWSRSVPSEGQQRGMGVKFDDLSPSAKNKINTIVKRLRSIP